MLKVRLGQVTTFRHGIRKSWSNQMKFSKIVLQRPMSMSKTFGGARRMENPLEYTQILPTCVQVSRGQTIFAMASSGFSCTVEYFKMSRRPSKTMRVRAIRFRNVRRRSFKSATTTTDCDVSVHFGKRFFERERKKKKSENNF